MQAHSHTLAHRRHRGGVPVNYLYTAIGVGLSEQHAGIQRERGERLRHRVASQPQLPAHAHALLCSTCLYITLQHHTQMAGAHARTHAHHTPNSLHPQPGTHTSIHTLLTHTHVLHGCVGVHTHERHTHTHAGPRWPAAVRGCESVAHEIKLERALRRCREAHTPAESL